MSLINIRLFVNNSNNNHYLQITNNRSVSTSDQLNSKTNQLINNSINGGHLPNSETAPLTGKNWSEPNGAGSPDQISAPN